MDFRDKNSREDWLVLLWRSNENATFDEVTALVTYIAELEQELKEFKDQRAYEESQAAKGGKF